MTHSKGPVDQDDEQTIITPGSSSKRTVPAAPPPIEVVISRKTQTPAVSDVRAESARFPMLEVWTRNRVYIIDSSLKCIEVRDQHSGLPLAGHKMLDALLVGGQRRYENTVHFSRPFPVPGTEALFVHPDKRLQPMGRTSKVERVVLNVHIDSVAISDDEADWADVTAHLLKNPLSQLKK